jgi:membrane-bound acyltransferase YfiQ involved in biofilm formation
LPGDSVLTFLNAYFTLIDIIAIVAVVILVAVAFFRKETMWMGLLAIVVAIWAASAVFGLY